MQDSTQRVPFPRHPKDSSLKLELQICEYDDITVVFCEGKIAYRDEAAALSEKISTLLPRTRQLVLELTEVHSIDSAGLGELVLILMWARACDCVVRVATARPQMLELLELTNLSSVFEVHPTLLDAMLAFGAEAA